MKTNLINGEWKTLIKNSRPIWELTRNEKEIKSILIESGYNLEAYKAFNNSIKNLFEYASQFIHEYKKGSSTELLDEINVSKEDAYMIYTNSISIVYLILRKVQYNS